ncbi:MAG: PIN domain-containing protein [Nocardiopsaceae bacterium]|nr:PIN domain-containing protein [Nocardiopsaceae bacterium]
MDAFDADALIYAAIPGHPLGERVAALFPDALFPDALFSDAPSPDVPSPAGSTTLGAAPKAGVGSVLLLPEVLSKPLRDGETTAVRTLSALLARLDLRPVDRATALLSAVLGARYGLRAADAVHLATAVNMGADRFITNNRRDFPASVKEIDVTYPGDLTDPA